MSKRPNSFLLKDIVEAAEKIESYTADHSLDSFCKDSKTSDAVIRNFEIIGEAANRLTEDFKDNHSTIDWHKIRGFRNRIVHDYIDIDYEIVWQIKLTFLPKLTGEIKTLLESLDD